ncbi:MAG: methyltransferase domain-containing protein [Desulfomonilaceae bacterium]
MSNLSTTSNLTHNKETKKRHYESAEYLGSNYERLGSYRYQLLWSLHNNPSSILLVGKGDGLVSQLIERAGVKLTTLDIDPDLSPDIIGSVESINSPDKSFDVSLCCQILEHLPYERFEPALHELYRVTRNRLILSLPDIRYYVLIHFSVPRVTINWQFSLPRFPRKEIPTIIPEVDAHFWEIGYKLYPISKIKRAITDAGWNISRIQRCRDVPYHTFIECNTKPQQFSFS